jgi:hypothetical protein
MTCDGRNDDIEFDNVGARRSDLGDVVLENGVLTKFSPPNSLTR